MRKASSFSSPFLLNEEQYRQTIQELISSGADLPPLSIIIPVFNEEGDLPLFLESLASCLKTFGIPSHRLEAIFMAGGCTDRSVPIIESFILKNKDTGGFRLQLINNQEKKGIFTDIRFAITNRTVDGYIALIDSDVIVEKVSLGLLYAALAQNQEIQAAYAEPVPINKASIANFGEHNPAWRSKRLYIQGRVSMYRQDPSRILGLGELKKYAFKAHDILWSFGYVKQFGFKSIVAVPGAIVYSKPASTLYDLFKVLKRTHCEINRIIRVFPEYGPLVGVFQRNPVIPSDIFRRKTSEIAMGLVYYVIYRAVRALSKKIGGNYDDWVRVESTKTKIEFKVLPWDENEHLLTPANTTAVVAIARVGQKYAMVRHAKRGWDIPAGHIEKGEEPDAALQREMREELGCEVLAYKPVGIISSNRDEQPTYLILYAVDIDEQYGKALQGHRRPGEIEAVSLVDSLEDVIEKYEGGRRLIQDIIAAYQLSG